MSQGERAWGGHRVLRQTQLHTSALSWFRRYKYRGADGFGALLHDVLAHVLAALHGIGGKANTIVLHRKRPELALFYGKLDQIGFGMFAHIGQRFLHYVQHLYLNVGRQG